LAGLSPLWPPWLPSGRLIMARTSKKLTNN
jgi:hypothetical protein